MKCLQKILMTSYLRLYISYFMNVVSQCIKSAPIWSYSGPYSVRMRKNTDQNNSKYGYFLCSVYHCKCSKSHRLKKDSHTLSQDFCKFINRLMFILQDITGHSEKERKLQYKIFHRQKQNLRSSFWTVLLKGYSQMRSRYVFCKKGVLKNFPKFTGKHQKPEFFFNKVAGLSLQVYLKKRP